MPENTKALQYLDFIQKAESLKSTPRSAHTATGRPESTAEHSWRLALLAMVLEDDFPDLDRHRILKLCLVHDLGEAIGGDIPAVDQKAGRDKAAGERADLLSLAASLPEKQREEIIALWDEYDNAATPEARLVKGLDKLETLIQHNQGLNPPDFNYEFNLEYGREYMSAHPILGQLRRIIDKATAGRAGFAVTSDS